MLGGVLGGFAEYTNTDPTLVRLGYILLTLILCVPFILFYIICWFVIPKNPTHIKETPVKESKEEIDDSRETHQNHSEDVSYETKPE
jgi:phage shock protein PspC (stress-responsive transcriptional regulator)